MSIGPESFSAASSQRERSAGTSARCALRSEVTSVTVFSPRGPGLAARDYWLEGHSDSDRSPEQVESRWSEILSEVHVGVPFNGDAVPAEDLPKAVPLIEAGRLEGEGCDKHPPGAAGSGRALELREQL